MPVLILGMVGIGGTLVSGVKGGERAAAVGAKLLDWSVVLVMSGEKVDDGVEHAALLGVFIDSCVESWGAVRGVLLRVVEFSG